MSITSITGTTQTSALSSISFQPSAPTTTAAPPAGDTTTLSKMGDLMKQLSDLEQTDPAKAKQVLQTIAAKLTDAASSATGPEATHLKDLASKFSSAADTGDLSKLQPAKAGHHHGGHHHAAPAASTDTDTASTTTSAMTSATDKYKANAQSDMSQVESIMSDALSSSSS